MMKFLIVLSVCAIAVQGRFVHMEKALETLDFLKTRESDKSVLHEVVFAVKQRNLDVLDQFLLEVSTPGSSKYGKHLTRAEVATITANPEATSAIEEYLAKNGARVVKKTRYGEYITAQAPISLWEQLFATTFYEFKFANNNERKPIHRSFHYSVDESLSTHVEAVFQTTQFPHVPAEKLPLREVDEKDRAIVKHITPAKINSFYKVTSNTGNSLASQSVFESIGQYYSPSDLLLFESNYGIPSQNVTTDIGGFESDAQCVKNANNCVEANLDVQYLIGISQATPTTYWYDGATDSFLDWIKAVSDAEKPPLVNSISYGATETSIPKSIATQFDTEAMKLGVQGVSIFVSSGDDGAAGNGARTNANKCSYSPSYPATSTYVTAVGATQGAESDTTEIACSSSTSGVITSGGGFSTIFSAPSWQTASVASYFKSVSAAPVSGYATGGRGYPDISLAGLNYEVVVGGKTYAVSGTSASSPTVAAFVSLVNAARLKAGKSALGFLNPSIYAYGASFANDITTGDNKCTAGTVCCSQGFLTSSGWDPVTGFGSIDFPKFYAIFYNL